MTDSTPDCLTVAQLKNAGFTVSTFDKSGNTLHHSVGEILLTVKMDELPTLRELLRQVEKWLEHLDDWDTDLD
jgi:hypothetical protein